MEIKILREYSISYRVENDSEHIETDTLWAGSKEEACSMFLKDHLSICEDWIVSVSDRNPWDILQGKTISTIDRASSVSNDSDTGYLVISFSDNSRCLIEGGYVEQCTEGSKGEYPTVIGLKMVWTTSVSII